MSRMLCTFNTQAPTPADFWFNSCSGNESVCMIRQVLKRRRGMRLQESLTLLCLVLDLLLLLFLACISRVGRRRRQDGGWGLSVKLFSIDERCLLAGCVIVCICLFGTRIFSASDRGQFLKVGRHVDVSGQRWQDTDAKGLTARLFNNG